jgi:hypothetical protein
MLSSIKNYLVGFNPFEQAAAAEYFENLWQKAEMDSEKNLAKLRAEHAHEIAEIQCASRWEHYFSQGMSAKSADYHAAEDTEALRAQAYKLDQEYYRLCS